MAPLVSRNEAGDPYGYHDSLLLPVCQHPNGGSRGTFEDVFSTRVSVLTVPGLGINSIPWLPKEFQTSSLSFCLLEQLPLRMGPDRYALFGGKSHGFVYLLASSKMRSE